MTYLRSPSNDRRGVTAAAEQLFGLTWAEIAEVERDQPAPLVGTYRRFLELIGRGDAGRLAAAARAETVGWVSRGYDAGKNDWKRHLAVDTCGLLLAYRHWRAGP
jgi:hypothetical protein